MKKYIILSLVAFSTIGASAQTNAKDSIAAAKLAAKVQKEQMAADLKAFKEKQKAELAAFVEKQKAGKNNTIAKPELKDAGDSIAYIFGAAQAGGLKQYMQSQLNIDTAYINDFAQGIIENVGGDSDPVKKAYFAGVNIAGQIESMTQSFSKDYYAAEPDKAINATIIANSIVAGLLGTNEYSAENASALFQQIMEKRQAANKEALYGANRIAGQKWLEENKTKDGVVTLPSGLQYKILTQGNGPIPTATDKVKVNYEGKLIDGTVFDSSYKRGQPTSFGVRQVISGWTEALQLMPVGSKWELYIPYDLAYGDQDTGREIKPYSALIFTVELLDIETKQDAIKETTVNKADKNTKTTAKKK